MRERCDMCGGEIESGKCSCGTWSTNEETKHNDFKKALEHFHDLRQFSLTGDAPHLGCAVIYFRGDYNDCKKVEKLILTMKNRPFYQEEI